MYTIILLFYLQAGLTVSLAGAAVSGEYTDLAACKSAAVRAIHTLPIPQGYAAAWQDASCTEISRGVRVGNERMTAVERTLFAALQPQPCATPAACRAAGVKSGNNPGDKPAPKAAPRKSHSGKMGSRTSNAKPAKEN